MSNWFSYPLTLEGQTVDLISLDEKYFQELIQLAKDKRIWEHYIYDGSQEVRFKEWLDFSMNERDKGNHFPFVIWHKEDQKIIGSTRFMDMQPKHKKLEIGTTWLIPEYWGTIVNLECKLLLLTYCFEKKGAVRVQLKTDENNIRSRKAIEKIGGSFEGILRNDMIRGNNTHRNSVMYSILDNEWEAKKTHLMKLLQEKRKAHR